MKKNKDEKQKGLLSALRYAVNRAFRYAWFLLIPMILVTILNSFLPAISGYTRVYSRKRQGRGL